jgi:hypothetical protein
MRTRIYCFIFFFILVPVGLCQAAEAAASLFPLEKDSYWVYKGTVRWTPEGVGSRVRSRSIIWHMKIRDVIESPKHRIAIVTGFPGDLAWYEEGMTPRWSLLVEDDRRIYRGDYETKDEAFGAARAIKTGGRRSAGDLECILEFPLKKGKKYGTRNKSRVDATHAWSVDGAEEVNLKIRGYNNRGPVTQYRLNSSTNPDRTIMEFVPGLGITRYTYEHHGTVAFEDVRLVEYGRVRRP